MGIEFASGSIFSKIEIEDKTNTAIIGKANINNILFFSFRLFISASLN